MTKADISWTIETGVGVVLLIVAAVIAGFGFSSRTADGRYARKFGISMFLIVAVLLTVNSWPFDMDYHQYSLKAGTVAADPVPRILTSGTGQTRTTDQVYPVAIDGVGVFRCDDSRCALLHKGDTVALWCERQYQWASTPGWTCRFKSSTEAPDGS